MRRGPYRRRRSGTRSARRRRASRSCTCAPTPNARSGLAVPVREQREVQLQHLAPGDVRVRASRARRRRSARPPPRTPPSCHAGGPSRPFRWPTSRRGRRRRASARRRADRASSAVCRGAVQTVASGSAVAGLEHGVTLLRQAEQRRDVAARLRVGQRRRPAARRRTTAYPGSGGSASSAPSRSARAASGSACRRAARSGVRRRGSGPRRGRASAAGGTRPWRSAECAGSGARASRVSGSDHGRGPECCGSQRRPIGFHSAPKLRFRSTPRPFWRVPRARPSGFRFWTTQTSVSTGAPARSSRRVICIPAHSLPWMQPTTSRRRGASRVAEAVDGDRAPERRAAEHLAIDRPACRGSCDRERGERASEQARCGHGGGCRGGPSAWTIVRRSCQALCSARRRPSTAPAATKRSTSSCARRGRSARAGRAHAPCRSRRG